MAPEVKRSYKIAVTPHFYLCQKKKKEREIERGKKLPTSDTI